MVLVFSSSANASQQIHREIERAVSKGVPILPVRIEEVTPTKSMEYFLGAIHWLDALSPLLEQHLHKLGETVKAMLKADATAGEPSGNDAQPPSVVAAVPAFEPPPQRAEQLKGAAAAKLLPAKKAVRPRWFFPAIGGALMVLLIAGGGWLYHLGIFAPLSAPQPDTQSRQATPVTLRTAAQARNFLMGAKAVISGLQGDAIYSSLLAQEYNIIVPESVLWFDHVHPSRTETSFTEADTMFEFAGAHGLKVIGQSLVWLSGLPPWLTNGNLPAAEVSTLLKEHIQTLIRRYRGRVYSWDVVRLAFDNLGKMRNTFWSRTLGPDFVEQAFVWAREADPQAKLFLVEYANFFDSLGAQSDAIYDLLKKFRMRGVPVDGIGLGLPMLLDRLPKVEDLAANMKRLSALGLEIHLTEFEVSMPLPPTAENLQRQAVAYNAFLSTCLAVPACKGFTIWGVTDKDAYAPRRWQGMGVGAAMPFDELYKPKPAYKAMLDALNDRRADLR
jgi:endo-1,4-beta-xylanase